MLKRNKKYISLLQFLWLRRERTERTEELEAEQRREAEGTALGSCYGATQKAVRTY